VDLISIARVPVIFVGVQFVVQVAAIVVALMIWDRIRRR